jgi:hypothetical protein
MCTDVAIKQSEFVRLRQEKDERIAALLALRQEIRANLRLADQALQREWEALEEAVTTPSRCYCEYSRVADMLLDRSLAELRAFRVRLPAEQRRCSSDEGDARDERRAS